MHRGKNEQTPMRLFYTPARVFLSAASLMGLLNFHKVPRSQVSRGCCVPIRFCFGFGLGLGLDDVFCGGGIDNDTKAFDSSGNHLHLHLPLLGKQAKYATRTRHIGQTFAAGAKCDL